jgi:hypothetical protein
MIRLVRKNLSIQRIGPLQTTIFMMSYGVIE